MAGVIRSEQLVSAPAFSFGDIERQAQDILKQSRIQAAQIIREAQARADQLAAERKQEGYTAGFNEGREAGLVQIRNEAHAATHQQMRERFGQLAAALESAAAAFEREKRGLIASAETGLIRLALSIAQRVCKLAVGRSSAPALANARRLLEMVEHASDLQLAFHPQDYDALREVAPRLLEQSEKLSHVTIIADQTVSPGGSTLGGAAGVLDATIEAQLERIAQALCPGDPAPAPPLPELAAAALAESEEQGRQSSAAGEAS